MYTGVRNNTGVSEDGLRTYVPSIFAEEPHESRSSQFKFISTWEILQRMEKEGFMVTSAQQSKSRDASKREFTKHVVRLRHRSINARIVGDSIPEILLRNAHDGSASYGLMAGIFRLVCSNGMIVKDASLIPDIKVMHKGDIINDVLEGSFKVVESVEKISAVVEQWKGITLDNDLRNEYANEVAKIRFGDEPKIQPIRLLYPRRQEDASTDLWSLFNVAQENIIKGGLSQLGNRNRRGYTMREIKGVDQDLKLNQQLWELTSKFAKGELV